MTNINHQIVKYHNDLNTVIMRKWTSEEMNFFFAIIVKVRNQGSSTMIFDTNEIQKITGFSQKSKARWQEIMKNCAKKITQLTYFEDSGKRFEIMTLFSKFVIDYEKNIVEVKVSENFSYVLNQLDSQFTMYELEEFTSIRSTYAKTAYRIFKQWRTVGKKEFTIDEFRMMMDMPENYKPCHIDRLVIQPIIKEVSPYFVGLRVYKIKSTKRGNPVLGYKFTWKPEKIVVDAEAMITKPRNRKKVIVKEKLPQWAKEENITKNRDFSQEENVNVEELKNWLMNFDKKN